LLVLVVDVILTNGVGAGVTEGTVDALAERLLPEAPDVLVFPVISKKLKGK
jgi:hypothetical protein